MQRIMVTGGAGFLGSHLCERLFQDGHEIVCVDDFTTGSRDNVVHLLASTRFHLVRHDVTRSLPLTASARVDEIYHLACPASPVHYQRDPVRTILTAVHGTWNMLELARLTGARILLASSSEVYGDPMEHPQRETYWGKVNPVGVRACYDEGKRCAEALTVSYAHKYGVETRIARIFNTYGPRMRGDDGRVVASFILQALRGDPITVYGTGCQTRSFCYVSDLVEALLRLMRCPLDPGPVNLGNSEEISMNDLASMVLSLTASSSPLRRMPLPGDDPARRCPDITRARELLDWQPRIDLRAGLQMTIDHVRQAMSSAPDPDETQILPERVTRLFARGEGQ